MVLIVNSLLHIDYINASSFLSSLRWIYSFHPSIYEQNYEQHDSSFRLMFKEFHGDFTDICKLNLQGIKHQITSYQGSQTQLLNNIDKFRLS